MSSDYSKVIYDKREDGVLVITLNRPEALNAFGGEIVPELIDALGRARTDEEVRAVVLTGTGRGFSAGADVSGARKDPEDTRVYRLDRMGWPATIIQPIMALDKPAIGAINGVAAGAGVGVALALDIRIASTTARFTCAFVKRALGPDFSASYFLPRMVGLGRAFEIFYTGRFIEAEEAERIGLVNRVVPPEQLMDEAIGLARELAAGPPLALALTRRALHRTFQNDVNQQLEYEWTNRIWALATQDAAEGRLSWQEKRPPSFLGR